MNDEPFGRGAPPASSRIGFAPAPTTAVKGHNVNRLPQAEDLVALAAKISAARASRKNLLPSSLFGEPGWDMLLALYISSRGGRRFTVSNLCQVSQSPDTTALRWIEKLVELRLVTRQANALDARVVFIEIEPKALNAIEDYLIQVWASLY